MNDVCFKKSVAASLAFALCVWLAESTVLAQVTPKPLQEPPPTLIKMTVDGIDPASLNDITFPDPTKVKLIAKDNFEIFATYYGGIHLKKSPAIILLHDVLGSSADLSELAAFLQKTYGYAVLVPDLRGHGDSQKTGEIEIDPAKITRAEFDAFMLDIEACKKFLIAHNDEGELNIDMLIVVGVGKTCVPTVNWTLGDWSYPALVGLRQGQDVKGVVLISPEQSFKGVRMTNALRAPIFTGKEIAEPLRMLLAVGKNDEALVKEADAIREIVARHRKPQTGAIDGLFVLADYETNGAELTQASAGDLQSMIGQFVYLEIFQKADNYPWQLRAKK